MQRATIIAAFSVGGIHFRGSLTRSAEGQISHVLDLPAGQAGAISANGIDGLATGHGIVQTDVIDVHWTDPTTGDHKCRRGITVDGASANAITFDNDPAAEGDALPAEDAAVVASVQQVIDTDWDGDDVELVACQCNRRAMADFRTDAASLAAVKLAAREAWSWAAGQGIANPLTGDAVDTIVVSNGAVTAGTLSIGLLYDSA